MTPWDTKKMNTTKNDVKRLKVIKFDHKFCQKLQSFFQIFVLMAKDIDFTENLFQGKTFEEKFGGLGVNP